jgi:hypothetical protein
LRPTQSWCPIPRKLLTIQYSTRPDGNW